MELLCSVRVKALGKARNKAGVLFGQFNHVDGVAKSFQIPGNTKAS